VQAAGGVLRELLKHFGLEARLEGFKAAECWPELVGPAFASRTSVKNYENGRLIIEPHHSVFCSSPHSLHVYATRTCPGAAKTRFRAPHFPHMASIRVLPCFTATVFRSIASFTRRSVSSRIDCFDISRFLPLLPPRSYRNQRHFSAEQVEKRRRVDSTSTSS